jgi:hypothetical protein
MSEAASKEYLGWESDPFGNLTFTIMVAGEHIRLAIVTRDPGTGLFSTFIGLPVSSTQLGRRDSSSMRGGVAEV